MSTSSKPYVAKVSGALDALTWGGAMRFCSGRDSLPVLPQLQQRSGAKIAIRYQQRDPGAIVIDFVKPAA